MYRTRSNPILGEFPCTFCFRTQPTCGDTPRSTARKVENRKCDEMERRNQTSSTLIDRAENSLSIGISHSRKDPWFLSALQFLSHRLGNVHCGHDQSCERGEGSNNRSLRIGQIEPQVAGLRKERKIPRLLTVFALTFVFPVQRNPQKKSHDDDDSGTPPRQPRSAKRRANNFAEKASQRTNGGSTERA